MRILAPAVKLPGKITISRMSSNKLGDAISIEIEDAISGCILLEALLTPETFGIAITGASYQDCELEYYGPAVAGKQRELKHELIKVPEGSNLSDPAIKAKLLTPYLVDGWRDNGGLGNHHCAKYNGDGTSSYAVGFIRWV